MLTKQDYDSRNNLLNRKVCYLNFDNRLFIKLKQSVGNEIGKSLAFTSVQRIL